MADAYSNAGAVWWLFAILAFVVAFALRKTGLLKSDHAQSKFATWGSAVVAACFAILADTPSSNGLFVELLGRGAIFLLVWLVVGIMFAIGVAMAAEKTGKR